jgi:hypothetical protein
MLQTTLKHSTSAGPGTTAWSHDFLNKKPWHPLNFRNQIKFYEAEQEMLAREKREAASKAEFEAEQQYLETLAHLPSKEANKYRAMQGLLLCCITLSSMPKKDVDESVHWNGMSVCSSMWP